MKPQDILVLLKICVLPEGKWSIAELAKSVSMSASEVHAAIGRLEKADLLYFRKPKTSSVEEFIIHGLRYAFPAEIGRECRGIPTSHAAPPLLKSIVFDKKDVLVWAYEFGTARGQSVTPLYKSVPVAATKDPRLHELLAIVDAIRIGRARERALAIKELPKYIRNPGK